jgi:hypothetical protein
MKVDPQKEHHWLQQIVGEWTFESEACMGPGQPPMKATGTEAVRSLGGLYVLCEGRGEMPSGGEMKSVMTLGYDPAKKRFVGTFIASCMTHLWAYDGVLDAAEKVLTLDTEGPSFTAEGKMARFQDILEIKSDDHRVLSSRFLGEDGDWHPFMTANYRRVK